MLSVTSGRLVGTPSGAVTYTVGSENEPSSEPASSNAAPDACRRATGARSRCFSCSATTILCTDLDVSMPTPTVTTPARGRSGDASTRDSSWS